MLQQKLYRDAQPIVQPHVGSDANDISDRWQAEQFVRHVISVVAHDISSPMAAIALCVSLLEGAGVPDQIAEHTGHQPGLGRFDLEFVHQDDLAVAGNCR